jgi:MFS family permease
MRSIALITLIDSVGLGLYSTGAIVFFVRSLHLSVGFIGASLTTAASVGLLMSVPAGRFADKRGAKQMLVTLAFGQATLFALFPLVNGPVALLVVVIGASLAASATQPARRLLIVRLFGENQRVTAAAYSRSVLNVGISIGALLAAGALAADTRPAYNALFIGNAASFVIVGLLVARLRLRPRQHLSSSPASPTPARPSRHPLRQPRFVAASMSCGILHLSAANLDVGLALQVSQHTNAPRAIIGFLLRLNTVLVVLFQVRASKGSETVPGATRANRLAGVVLLGSCILFPLSSQRTATVAVVLLIGATTLLTAGELYSSAAAWGLSYGLAPENREGEYIASFLLVSQVVQVIGPLLAAAVVSGGTYAWLGLGVVYLITGLVSPLTVGKRDD